MKRWIEPETVDVAPDLQARVGGHPLVAQTLVRRRIATVAEAVAFLDPDAYTPASAYELPQMAEAVTRVRRAVDRGERVCVWGDFDVDGQTATTLLVDTLTELGAAVSYHIPVRDTESHGITVPALQAVLDDGVQLILTCDTGISEHEPIAHAQARGVDVVVTDHHALPPELPAAHALVNPQMLPSEHPLHTLPGVGVAYKLAEALYAEAGRPDRADRHLDLVALGIVADIAVQRGDTRYLLQRGLAALRRTQRLGLQVLIKTAGLDPAWLSEEHIGFGLGPRLNALGRLADANAAVELLTTTDLAHAQLLATQLEGLNARRKLMCDHVFQAAMAQLERDPSLLEGAVLVLDNPSWPAGVIGIVASRLVDHFHRPTILIASPPGERARGSARSVEGCNITEAIAAQAHLVKRFGGHPMAAGLVIDEAHIPEFRRAISRTVADIGGAAQEATLAIDGILSLADISMELIADLGRLSPFGAGNPPLTLMSENLTLTNPRQIGRNQEHRQVNVKDEAGNARQVVWWRGSEWPLPRGRFDLAYTLRASNFRGKREVQIEWVDARSVAAEDEADPRLLAGVEVVDHRAEADPLKRLKQLQEQSSMQVWCEAEANLDILGRSRLELSPSEVVAVWTAPPSPQVLQAALDAVRPERVYLFGINPGMDGIQSFLSRLVGLVKFAVGRRQGTVQVSKLAAATAQTEWVVRAGIAWLTAKGTFELERDGGDALHITSGNGAASEDLPKATQQLQALLRETAAYRTHFAKAERDRLVGFEEVV